MTVVNVSKLWKEPRCGTVRAGMKTNCLLTKSDLGKVRKTTFVDEDPNTVFGTTNSLDGEGAREVTMIWKEHQANPDAKPGPDFCAMNKLAAVSGLTAAKHQPPFRSANPLHLKTGKREVRKSLPSTCNTSTTYGTPSAHRTAEQVRAAGPEEPPIKHIIQGAYQFDWIGMNIARADSSKTKRCTFQATPTKASTGHTIGAQQHMQIWSEEQPKEGFKLSKFKRVPAKVTEYNGTLRRLPQQSAAQGTHSSPIEEPQTTEQDCRENAPHDGFVESQENDNANNET